MGGAIVQLLAAGRPPWLEKAIVAGGGAQMRVEPEILDGLRPEVGRDGFERAVNLICQQAYGPLASRQMVHHSRQLLLAVDRDVFYADYLACDGFDASDALEHIRLPVLVISGSLDRMTPPPPCEDRGLPQDTRTLSQHIPGAQLVEIRDAGHMMILEKPGEVAQEVSRFLGLHSPCEARGLP